MMAHDCCCTRFLKVDINCAYKNIKLHANIALLLKIGSDGENFPKDGFFPHKYHRALKNERKNYRPEVPFSFFHIFASSQIACGVRKEKLQFEGKVSRKS